MRIELSQRFVKQYQKQPATLQLKVDKALLLLLESDFRHPGLRSHRIAGEPGTFEAYVDVQYRLTFERGSEAFILRNLDNYVDCLRTF
jgi:hypothetical protein